MADEYVQVHAVLKADATATPGNDGKYFISILIRVLGRFDGNELSTQFEYPACDSEGLRELMNSLRKDKVVILLAKLESEKVEVSAPSTTPQQASSGSLPAPPLLTLVAEFVRIDRIDYRITEAEKPKLLQLLPPQKKH